MPGRKAELAQLLAQLADVALDDVLLDLVVEDTVDRVEDLGLGDAAAPVACQIFQDAALAARQRQRQPLGQRRDSRYTRALSASGNNWKSWKVLIVVPSFIVLTPFRK